MIRNFLVTTRTSTGVLGLVRMFSQRAFDFDHVVPRQSKVAIDFNIGPLAIEGWEWDKLQNRPGYHLRILLETKQVIRQIALQKAQQRPGFGFGVDSKTNVRL